jgi:hypothetical protein
VPAKPTYQWIEAAVMDSECTSVTETPADLRAEVWMAVAGGANAIGYFTHHSSLVWDRFAVAPDLRAEMARLNDELRALAPALLGQQLDVAVDRGNPVRAGARLSNGALYAIAVNPTTRPLRVTMAVRGLASRTVTVLGERRTLRAKRGTITDSFGPLEAKVYVAPPSWTLPSR